MYLIDKPSLPRINVSISTLYNYTMFSKHWPHAEEITISICRLPVLAVQKICSNNGKLIMPKKVFLLDLTLLVYRGETFGDAFY